MQKCVRNYAVTGIKTPKGHQKCIKKSGFPQEKLRMQLWPSFLVLFLHLFFFLFLFLLCCCSSCIIFRKQEYAAACWSIGRSVWLVVRMVGRCAAYWRTLLQRLKRKWWRKLKESEKPERGIFVQLQVLACPLCVCVCVCTFLWHSRQLSAGMPSGMVNMKITMKL